VEEMRKGGCEGLGFEGSGEKREAIALALKSLAEIKSDQIRFRFRNSSERMAPSENRGARCLGLIH
jgi:hypothetical protein